MEKNKKYIGALLQTVMSQGIVLGLSVVTGFILPQRMGPESFGYWQIYLFYLAYVNLLGLGFNDGIALYYGGYTYQSLPFRRIRSSMSLFGIFMAVMVLLGGTIVAVFVRDDNYRVIYYALVLNIPVTCIQCIIMTAFLAVGNTKLYNLLNVILKSLSVALYIVVLFFRGSSFKYMITADLIARSTIGLICLYKGRALVFGARDSLAEGWKEFYEKASAGIKITIALVASMLIPVMGRWIIERFETIEVYGIYSFGLSLLTIVLSFTNVLGTVIFPFLKKMDEKTMKENYGWFTLIGDLLIAAAMMMYLPLMFIVRIIMVKYIPALDYLHVLMAMCLPLGRMQLFLTPYYKACRIERGFLITNIVGVISMIIVLLSSYMMFQTPLAVATGTTITLTVWTYGTEYYLKKKTGISSTMSGIIREVLVMCSFILAASFGSAGIFTVIYVLTLGILLFFNRKAIKATIKQ